MNFSRIPQYFGSLFILLPLSSAFFLAKSFQSRPKCTPLTEELEGLIIASRAGLDVTYEEKIREMMIEISQSRNGDQRQSLSGLWELVYTTEKEINFFKTSWPFAKVSVITQKLDLANAQTVNNNIQFEGGGKFAVTGDTNIVDGDDEYDRVAFEFTDAKAFVWGKKVQLPPVGIGWFDTMYCDGDIRLSRDSRGDWSVFRRIE
mmetsp:Transcript_9498/g.23311  ORF Transcript_9498/g.23311 Transcript_9498/m.23311 type:complete len:204 (+) Transcript_9498:165-776(+)